MGTSQSSKGSPSGVPMVPPWVPDPPPPAPPPVPEETVPQLPEMPTPEQGPEPTTPAPVDINGPIPTAPAGRFRAANINLAAYARNSDRAAMRRGVGQYFSQGYGGGATAVRRFSGTARTADALYAALSGGAAALGIPEANVDAGSSAQEIMDAVTEAVRPVDGTQDTESSRAAIQDALAETLTQFPDADLTNLSEEQKEIAIERYVASDVYRRFSLDVGRTVITKAPNAVAGASRLKEIREYVRETVSAAFRKIRTAGQRLGAGRVASIVRSALGEAIQVFEGYL